MFGGRGTKASQIFPVGGGGFSLPGGASKGPRDRAEQVPARLAAGPWDRLDHRADVVTSEFLS